MTGAAWLLAAIFITWIVLDPKGPKLPPTGAAPV
jgi:hypothetical protein